MSGAACGLVMPPPRAAQTSVADVIAAIGGDRVLERGQLLVAHAGASVVERAWNLYAGQWQRFCGTTLDPQFWRFDHPAVWLGEPRITDAAPVIVAGTGPSLQRELDALRGCRDRFQIFTSPRGAEALDAAGLTPDLVVIEHQTALDAQFTMRAIVDRPWSWRQRVPFWAVDPRTPRALLDGLDGERVFVMDRAPSWGLWPATAVGLAQRGGASAIALLGVDLGSRLCPDPRQAPLSALLSLLATQGGVAHVDAGAGALKPGWHQQHLNSIAPGRTRTPLRVARRPWTRPAERIDAARTAWRRLEGLVPVAAQALAAAGAERDGRSPSPKAVERALDTLLEAGADVQVRDDVQAGLGCSFLPRYWRMPPDRQLGPQLWRPLALASHELVCQHRSLAGALRERGGLS